MVGLPLSQVGATERREPGAPSGCGAAVIRDLGLGLNAFSGLGVGPAGMGSLAALGMTVFWRRFLESVFGCGFLGGRFFGASGF